MDYKEILIKDASISWLCSVWFLLRGEMNWSASKKDELKMTYYVLVKLQAFINFSPLDDWWQLGDSYYHSFDGIQPAISATLEFSYKWALSGTSPQNLVAELYSLVNGTRNQFTLPSY